VRNVTKKLRLGLLEVRGEPAVEPYLQPQQKIREFRSTFASWRLPGPVADYERWDCGSGHASKWHVVDLGSAASLGRIRASRGMTPFRSMERARLLGILPGGKFQRAALRGGRERVGAFLRASETMHAWRA